MKRGPTVPPGVRREGPWNLKQGSTQVSGYISIGQPLTSICQAKPRHARRSSEPPKPPELHLEICRITHFGLQTLVCRPSWDSKHPCVAQVGNPNTYV